MIRRPGAALLAALFLASACASKDSGSDGPSTSTSATPRSAVPRSDVLKPVTAYVQAVNRKDRDALVASFAVDAEVIDVGRVFAGRDAIRGWADREVIGGALTVDAVVESRPGYQKLLVTFAPGGSNGFAAHYAFTVSGAAITRAELTYAD
ncbi:nuclear transport factor 2 family protein [Streptomyces cinnabarinus]|uniref:Nuclear transport factor 2 family protein n=1 Tax=Streptomyces cinnabarinus TaxID=67287 RepID=A0ABY7K4N1_9ACTN|nr:nuclear transport factor 2 family protein [Streptomyces cinnabarinus]WAZ19454.1 nuclear transport factor 2 family protein [Streptomyces cinnabarinus]